MTIVPTGHAEIDQQHEILENMVASLESLCEEAVRDPDADCRHCQPATRRQCSEALARIADELAAFLTGHATYEERMMDLLPDTPTCQAHVKAHKAAHEGLSRQMKKLSLRIAEQDPRSAGQLLWRMIGDWLGDHAALFDRRLVRLGKGGAPEIDFDAELVAMLDQHVFPNRPTRSKASPAAAQALQRQRLEIRGRFETLSPAQRTVFWLVVGGRKNREIAEALGVTLNTIKTHRAAIFQKMDVASVLELIKKADVLR